VSLNFLTAKLNFRPLQSLLQCHNRAFFVLLSRQRDRSSLVSGVVGVVLFIPGRKLLEVELNIIYTSENVGAVNCQDSFRFKKWFTMA
jgi:hypothetical protein